MNILLVDDDKNIRKTLAVTLQGWKHEVAEAASAEAALELVKSARFDFILTDFKMGGMSGIDLIKNIRQSAPTAFGVPLIVVMTAYASFENAVTAIQEGAFDYIAKPFSNAQLKHLLSKVAKVAELTRENKTLREKSRASRRTHREDYFSGQTSPAMQRLEEFVRKVAPAEASVLICGESGTGKTELAKLIHARSSRADRPFVVLDCTTLTEGLLESELFGHARGSFTGAVQEHMGKLELADHGTIFIDEIGELSLPSQTKLLRFLQERTIERVGSTAPVQLDVRIIAATNKKLEEAVKAGKFREDLYFRLNILECQVVPLRHRGEDLPVLIERFLLELTPKKLSKAMMDRLLAYPWPGNVRELRNALERMTLLSTGREITEEDLPDSFRTKAPAPQSAALRSLEEIEREHIARVLLVESNQERAAEILGITSVTLWRKRKQYGLP